MEYSYTSIFNWLPPVYSSCTIELFEVYVSSYAVTLTVYILQRFNISIDTSYSRSIVTYSITILSVSFVIVTRYNKLITSSETKDGGFQETLADSFILILNTRSSTGLIPVY